MSENDLIAEYVKENHPELLATMDFALFRLRAACSQFANDFFESFKKLDLTELKSAVDEFNKRNSEQQEDQQCD